MEAINSFVDQLPVWIPIITMIVTTAAAVAAVTPTKTDNQIVNAVIKVLNVLGLNIGRAKNKEP